MADISGSTARNDVIFRALTSPSPGLSGEFLYAPSGLVVVAPHVVLRRHPHGQAQLGFTQTPVHARHPILLAARAAVLCVAGECRCAEPGARDAHRATDSGGRRRRLGHARSRTGLDARRLSTPIDARLACAFQPVQQPNPTQPSSRKRIGSMCKFPYRVGPGVVPRRGEVLN